MSTDDRLARLNLLQREDKPDDLRRALGDAISLRLLDDNDVLLWEGELSDDGLRVGTAVPADVILPRARFVALARIEFELSLAEEGVHLRHFGTPRPCVVDGQRLREVTMSAGRHAIECGTVRLTLLIG